MTKMILTGVVIGAKSQKTAQVSVENIRLNRFYGRIERSKKKYQVHDPESRCVVGSIVKIGLCRPISKTKHFEFLEEVK